MKNNKGFSLIELLGVVTILGILMSLAMIAYTRYIEHSKKKAYETMIKSSISAMEEYLMDHPEEESVTFETLVNGEYLEYAADPSDKTKQCKGEVSIDTENEGTAGALDSNEYIVKICCANYNHTYTTKNKQNNKDDKCELD